MEGFVKSGEIFHHLSNLFHHQIGPRDNAYMDSAEQTLGTA